MRQAEQGFTLLEMMIVVAIFSIVLGALSSALVTGQKTFNAGMAFNQAQFTSERALNKITTELSQTGEDASNQPLLFIYNTSGTSLVDGGNGPATTLRFQKRILTNTGTIEWSANNYYISRIPTGNLADRVVLWEDVGNDNSSGTPSGNDLWMTLGTGVSDLQFTKKTGRIQIDITVDRGVAGEEKTMSVTHRTSVIIQKYQ